MSPSLNAKIAQVFDEPGCDVNQAKGEKERKKGCTKQLTPGAAAGGCAFDGAKIALQPIVNRPNAAQAASNGQGDADAISPVAGLPDSTSTILPNSTGSANWAPTGAISPPHSKAWGDRSSWNASSRSISTATPTSSKSRHTMRCAPISAAPAACHKHPQADALGAQLMASHPSLVLPRQSLLYAHAARCAVDAGFDGVEIHGANGYLIDQFLRDGTNHRTDDYGGSVQGRARFLLEVTEAVTGVWGKDRVGIRLSPNVAFNDMSDSDPAATFSYAAGELRGRLGYLHVIEGVGGAMAHRGPRLAPLLKQRFGGPLILNGGYDRDTAEAALAGGEAELISFGAPYLANPDLPARFLAGAPLNAPDQATFYSEGAKGYVDYPALAAG